MKKNVTNSSFTVQGASDDSEKKLVQSSEWRLQPDRFSSWEKLKRITAWVKKCVDNCRVEKNKRQSSELSYDELKDSEEKLIIN